MYIVLKQETRYQIQKIFQTENFEEAQSQMVQDFGLYCNKVAKNLKSANCKVDTAIIYSKDSVCNWQILKIGKKDCMVTYIAIRHIEGCDFKCFAETDNAYDARQIMLKNFESFCKTYNIEHLPIDDQYYMSHDQSNFGAQFDSSSAYISDCYGRIDASWAIFGI